MLFTLRLFKNIETHQGTWHLLIISTDKCFLILQEHPWVSIAGQERRAVGSSQKPSKCLGLPFQYYQKLWRPESRPYELNATVMFKKHQTKRLSVHRK